MTQGFDLTAIRHADFKRGAASRQAEIDELKRELEILQGMHNAVSLTAGELVDERDELQKRINLALSAVWNDELSHIVIDIMRGGSNEG